VPNAPTLLLADDSVTIQRLVALSFADEAVRVLVARDGQDAINRMATERPDLVLADTNMPCVDGYELARWVREQPHLRSVPVLLLAGATDPVDEQRLHDSGANGVLEKPFEPSHVISRVKELLGIKGPSPASPARLVTSDPAPPRPTPVAAPVARARSLEAVASAAREPVAADPAPSPDLDDFGPVAPLDDLLDAFDEREGADSQRPSPADLLARSVGPEPAGGGTDWFTEADLAEPGEQTQGRSGPTGTRRAAAVRVPITPPAPAEVFDRLLAAEQGDPDAARAIAGSVVVEAVAPELTDEMLGALADEVARALQPQLSTGLRDGIASVVQDTVAAEARAAVAEAVQAAVDGSILGTVRGAVHEAVAASVPAAVEQQVRAAVRESAEQAMSAAVEQAVRESVAAQVASLVRDTVEREIRDGVAPLVQQVVREMVGATLQQVVTDAVFSAVPPAVADAIRAEAAGSVRRTVQETSERLVREEITRIRERRG